ncbi:MAG: AAA family ATPase, partial [Phycisphaerae bacterium]|nr:AAA family ATPase [Phycisphaerae bacterium]
PVSDHVVDYAVELTRASRPKEGNNVPKFIEEYLTWGAGPRAAQYLILGAKARAVIRGRYNVSCDDVRAIAHPVLRHRLFTNFNADAEGLDSDAIVSKLLQTVPEPGVKDYAPQAAPTPIPSQPA